MPRSDETKPKVFISHTSADHPFVERLAADLERDGCEVWVDDVKMHIGDSIPAEVQQAISQAHFLIAVLSKASVRRRWVREELSAALVRTIESGRRFILPCVVETCQLPEFLRHRVYADFASSGYEHAYRRLVEVLRPGTEMLRSAFDPYGRGRMVVLIGTSTRLYQRGDSWSDAPSGAVGAEFCIKRALETVVPKGRQIIWNYADAMRPTGLCPGDNVTAIGAAKVNKFTAGFLAQCERDGLSSVWFVGREEWRHIDLFYALKGHEMTYRPTIDRLRGQGTGNDYGLLVWAPSLEPHRGMTVVVAGCHTAATHAAGFCAADPEFYRKLAAHVRDPMEIALAEPGCWAIVEVPCADFSPDLDAIRVCEAGRLSQHRRASSSDFEPRADIVWESPTPSPRNEGDSSNEAWWTWCEEAGGVGGSD